MDPNTITETVEEGDDDAVQEGPAERNTLENLRIV